MFHRATKYIVTTENVSCNSLGLLTGIPGRECSFPGIEPGNPGYGISLFLRRETLVSYINKLNVAITITNEPSFLCENAKVIVSCSSLKSLDLDDCIDRGK